MDRPVLVRILEVLLMNKKKKNFQVDFSVSADHKVNIKEIEKIDNRLDLAREQKKLSSMKVVVQPSLVGVLETVPYGLGKETGGIGDQKNNNHPDHSTIKMG